MLKRWAKLLAVKLWWDLFAERTTKDVVLHCDVSWVAHGGQDPVETLRKFPGRSKAIHTKPFVAHGDAGKREFIGHDSLDWKGIIAACYEVGGTEWFSVEQEAYPEGKSPMQCTDISIKGLKAILADTKYGMLYYE
jgi:sugar phosphate isomerase/epimerase